MQVFRNSQCGETDFGHGSIGEWWRGYRNEYRLHRASGAELEIKRTNRPEMLKRGGGTTERCLANMQEATWNDVAMSDVWMHDRDVYKH